MKQCDERLHTALYEKFPKAVAIGGWVLGAFYAIAISPAFAVFLAFALLGLVLSGVVTLIVFISAFGAWVVTILSLAKNESINSLRIGTRLIVVFGIAVLMGLVANRYVKWCLNNYARNQPVPVPAISPDNVADLTVSRMRDFLTKFGHTTEPDTPRSDKKEGPLQYRIADAIEKLNNFDEHRAMPPELERLDNEPAIDDPHGQEKLAVEMKKRDDRVNAFNRKYAEDFHRTFKDIENLRQSLNRACLAKGIDTSDVPGLDNFNNPVTPGYSARASAEYLRLVLFKCFGKN